MILPLSDEHSVSVLWIILLLGFAFATLIGPGRIVSHILNKYLSWQHSVKHLETRRSLPTVPYKFPNGQGDAAKFLNGKENSKQWQREYGPLYRIWSGRTPEIVLTQPEHIQEAFKDSDKHIKAKNNNSGYYMGQILGKCVGLISQEEWKSVRAVSERPFLKPAIESYVELIQRRTHSHFDDLRKSARLSDSVIDPAQDLKYLPFWIIAEIIYGKLSRDMEHELYDIAPKRERIFKHVIAGGLPRFTWSKYLPTSANQELHEFKALWTSFNRRARDHAVRTNTRTALVQMYQAVDSDEITEEHLLQTLDEMLYANLDVTLGGMSWNLVFLAAVPKAQARLRSEISTERQGLADLFQNYLLNSATYLAACISESSRLRPLAAFSVPQAAPTGRCIGGYYFPANTNFIIDSYALNQRHPCWGKDSSSFRPERFFEKTGVQTRYSFWRFGFGPRQCLGKYVADLMIRTLIVHIVENFELGILDEDEEWKRDPEAWINHPQMKLKCTSLVRGDVH